MIEFPNQAIVAFARGASNETDLKSAAIRPLHDIQILFPVSVENGNASLQCLQTGKRSRSDNRRAEPIGKESAVLHVSIVDRPVVQRMQCDKAPRDHSRQTRLPPLNATQGPL